MCVGMHGIESICVLSIYPIKSNICDHLIPLNRPILRLQTLKTYGKNTQNERIKNKADVTWPLEIRYFFFFGCAIELGRIIDDVWLLR